MESAKSNLRAAGLPGPFPERHLSQNVSIFKKQFSIKQNSGFENNTDRSQSPTKNNPHQQMSNTLFKMMQLNQPKQSSTYLSPQIDDFSTPSPLKQRQSPNQRLTLQDLHIHNNLIDHDAISFQIDEEASAELSYELSAQITGGKHSSRKDVTMRSGNEKDSSTQHLVQRVMAKQLRQKIVDLMRENNSVLRPEIQQLIYPQYGKTIKIEDLQRVEQHLRVQMYNERNQRPSLVTLQSIVSNQIREETEPLDESVANLDDSQTAMNAELYQTVERGIGRSFSFYHRRSKKIQNKIQDRRDGNSDSMLQHNYRKDQINKYFKPYILTSTDRKTWDLIVLFLAIENSIMVPLQISFHPHFMNYFLYTALEIIVDLIFVADMIVICLTAIRDEKGQEVRDFTTIAYYYITSFWFYPDLFSLFGNILFTAIIPSFQIFGILKVIRVVRLGKMIKVSNFQRSVKAPLNVFKFTFYLIIYIHVVGCLWWDVILQGEKEADPDGRFIKNWIPPTNWINYRGYDFIHEESSFFQYVFCVYHSVLLLGFNEMGPVNSLEMLFCTIVMLTASIFNAHIFSEIVVIMQSFNRRQTSQQEKLDKSNSVLIQLLIPLEKQKEIQEYFYLTLNTREDQLEFDMLMDQIAPSKKELLQKKVFAKNLLLNQCLTNMLVGSMEVVQHDEPWMTRIYHRWQTFKRSLTHRKFTVLAQQANLGLNSTMNDSYNTVLNYIVNLLCTLLSQPEEEIISYGEPGASGMYFVSKGDCIVKLQDRNGKHYLSDSLIDEGEHFGEIGMIYKCKRTATVISRNFNTMARLSYSNYRDVLNAYPKLEQYLKAQLFTYKDERKLFIMKVLGEVDYFKHKLSQEAMHDLIYNIEYKVFDQGELILKEGEPITNVLFIEFGVVEVYSDFDGHEFILDRLYSGSIINALAYLMQDLMYVNMRCKERCKILFLQGKYLDHFFTEHPKIFKDKEIYYTKMLRTTKKYPLDYIHRVPSYLIPREISFKEYDKRLQVRNTLKNVVIRRILKVRQRKMWPTLNDLLKKFRVNDGDARGKEKFIDKIKNLYVDEKKILEKNFETNAKYERLTQYFHRLEKSLKVRDEGLTVLVGQLSSLLIRRIKREEQSQKSSLGISETMYTEIENKVKEAKLKEMGIQLFYGHPEKDRAVKRAKEGFNPFYHKHFLKKNQIKDDQLDEDFKTKMNQIGSTKQIVRNQLHAPLKYVLLDDFQKQLKKYDILSVLAKPKKSDKPQIDLEPFYSSMLKPNLAIYKKWKRREFQRKLRGEPTQATIRSDCTIQTVVLEDLIEQQQRASVMMAAPDTLDLQQTKQQTKPNTKSSHFALHQYSQMIDEEDDESSNSQSTAQKKKQTETSSDYDSEQEFQNEINDLISSLYDSDNSDKIQATFEQVHDRVTNHLKREEYKDLVKDLVMLPKKRRSSHFLSPEIRSFNRFQGSPQFSNL